MKYLLAFCLAMMGFTVSAQTINDLIDALKKENWERSAEISLHFIQEESDTATSDRAAMLRYMYIKSVAGLLGSRALTKEQAIAKVKPFEGKRLIFAKRPIREKCSANCIKLTDSRPNTLFTNATNNAATEIHAFEYVTLISDINATDMEAIEGKFGRLEGYLKSIDVEGDMFPRFRIIAERGDLQLF